MSDSIGVRRSLNHLLCLLTIACLGAPSAMAQQAANSAVPMLVRFAGVLKKADGQPVNETVGVTFALYAEQEGGALLWSETQNIHPDNAGHYSVMLGSTTNAGLPPALFASGEARWVGVQLQGQPEQPRALLVSVPYAIKAGDAATVGGLPPSAFVLAVPPTSGSSETTSATRKGGGNAPTLGGSGTADYVPLWMDNNGTLGNSVIFQGGTASKPKVGINNPSPSATLDVKGTGTIHGALTLPSTATAKATGGKNSQPLDIQASVFNSTVGKAVTQTFQWQAEPVGNDTTDTSGSLNLLFGQGSNNPAETGLNISATGQITFAPGQTFPGTGNGTITGVTAGTDLTGGGTSGNITLNLDTTQVPQLNANNTFNPAQEFATSIGVAAPPNTNGYTPLALGGNNTFGTWMTLANTSSGGHTWNFLSAGSANSEGAGNLGITDFTGTSKIFLEGNVNAASLTAQGTVNGAAVGASTAFDFQGSPFITGSYGTLNEFFGFSVGNSTLTGSNNIIVGAGAFTKNTTGSQNTAVGDFPLFSNTTGSGNTATGMSALADNTTGGQNTADGYYSLYANTTGGGNTAIGSLALYDSTTAGNNTAVGYSALYYNQAGSNNTALGYEAGPDVNSPNLTNATALGSYAQVSESNALVLGSIKGLNGASANALVGIGTTAPTQSLQVDSGNTLVRGANNFQKNGDVATMFLGDTNNFVSETFGTGITLGVYMVPNAVRINQYSGYVGIGTTSPDNLLTVNGTADKVGGGSWGTYSDGRLKTLHGNFTSGLSQIMRLHPIRYRYKADNALGIRDRDEHIGFVAQDVQRIIPEAVTENDKGYLLVNNDPILWTMLNAIQQQQREIAGLRARLRTRPASASAASTPGGQELRSLRSQLTRLRTRDAGLEARLARLEQTLSSMGQGNSVLALASTGAAATGK